MEQKETYQGRPPIVAIVGHIDHGKSTLLDYIRKTRVTEGEAGGITQHLSAYQATHETKSGSHLITFLDTPGHEAFRAMRSRGLGVADIAILVVAADDGAKPQTVEAIKLIEEAKTPYIVAFTKIDKEGANLERAKLSLIEHGVFLEGQGGTISFAPVSSKTGEGIPELLDLILLTAELEELTADADAPASGVVIEANIDNKRGNTATLIVLNGTIESGEYVVSGESFAPVRIMENFLGKPIKEALPGSPVRIVGFSSLPAVGAAWRVVESKKEAENSVREAKLPTTSTSSTDADDLVILPIIIKSDFSGTGDAVLHELQKLPIHERFEARVVARGVGPITEGDVRLAGSGKNPGLIAGFNVKLDREPRELAERLGVEAKTFTIIYELAQWLGEEIEKRRPRSEAEEEQAVAKVLKIFSSQGANVVLGGRVESGEMVPGNVKFMRLSQSTQAGAETESEMIEVGRGELIGLQSQKEQVKKVPKGQEFGAMVKTSTPPQPGDQMIVFEAVLK
ncbi:MAG: translation initiation factor IF-2 [bacterium]